MIGIKDGESMALIVTAPRDKRRDGYFVLRR